MAVKKVDIFPPKDTASYPMTLLWIEDRQDRLVKAGEVIAVLDTTSGEVRLAAPFEGRIDAVNHGRGDRLKQRTALLRLVRIGPDTEAESSGKPTRTLDEEIDRHIEASGITVPDRQSWSWSEIGLIACLLLVLAVGGHQWWKSSGESGRIYDGPMSQARMMAGDSGSARAVWTQSMEAFANGQGILQVYASEEDNSYLICPAVLVGDNIAAVPDDCAASVYPELAPGRLPVAYFRTSVLATGHLKTMSFPVRELLYWDGPPGKDKPLSVALAVLRPAPGRTVRDDTGSAGFSVIDRSKPPAYLQVDEVEGEPGDMRSSYGCRFWSSSAPKSDAAGNRLPLSVEVENCLATRQLGVVREPDDGEAYFTGFFATSTAPGADGFHHRVTARLFGDRDFDLLDATAKGEIPAGFRSRAFRVADRQPRLKLVNSCGRDVRVYFASPGGDAMKYVEIKGGTSVWVDQLPFGGEYLFSVGRGIAGRPNTRELRFSNETYHMIEASTGSDQTLIWNEACTGG